MLPKKVDKKSKTLFYGKLEGVVHGTNMIMGPHFPLHLKFSKKVYDAVPRVPLLLGLRCIAPAISNFTFKNRPVSLIA